MHKFRNLDGLRGVAALTVVFSHYAASFYPAMGEMGYAIHTRYDLTVETTPLALLIAGNFAVCLFFVLSGFVLSAKFFRTKNIDAVISAAARRYLRLMLPALGSLLIIWFFLKLGLFRNLPAAKITGSGLLNVLWRYPLHLLDIIKQGSLGIFQASDPVGTNPPLWTLYYEFIGSFLIFLTLVLFGRLRHRWVFYVALCYVFHESYYLAFILGIIICDVWHNRPQLKPLLHRISWGLLPAGLLLGAWVYSTERHTFFNHFSLGTFTPLGLSIFAHTVGAAMVIIAALSLPLFKRLLELRPIQFLGYISFSLYLLHFIIIGTYSSDLFLRLLPNHSYNVAFAIMLVPSLLITFIASWIYARYIDAGSIQLAAFVGNKLVSDQSWGLRRLLARDLYSFRPSGTSGELSGPQSSPPESEPTAPAPRASS